MGKHITRVPVSLAHVWLEDDLGRRSWLTGVHASGFYAGSRIEALEIDSTDAEALVKGLRDIGFKCGFQSVSSSDSLARKGLYSRP